MSTPGYGLHLRRSLVSSDGVTTVRVFLTSDADEPLRFRLTEAGVEEPVTGTVAPGETAIVEYPAGDEARLEDDPVELVVEPVGATVTTDGGADETTSVSVADAADVSVQTTRRPAVGIVAKGSNEDAVARAVTRAVEAGYPVYVAHARDVDPEALEFVERLGGELVTLDRPTADVAALQRGLVVAARVDDHSGIILSSLGEPIDFGASTVSLATSGEFAIEAVTESPSGRTAPSSDVDRRATSGCVVGVPAYNEAERIADVVERARRFADVVVVVDDGSSDDTATRAAEAGAHVVEHGQNRGYGAALRSVFAEAARLGADTLAIVDGDGQHDMDDIRPLVETQRETGADLVIGSRFVEGSDTEMPLYRRFGVEVVNVLTNLALGRIGDEYIRDTQSGFRVYGRQAIETLAEDPTIGDGMNASTDIIFHVTRHDYSVVEAPTTVRYDLDDTSSMNPVSHGLHLVWNIASRTARERPLVTLGIPALVLSLLGLAFGYWAVFGFLQTGAVAALPMVAATLSLVVGLLGAVTAISLHTTVPESGAPTGSRV